MMLRCPLPEEAMDFSREIARHSGDKRVVYKEVDGQELLLSLYHPPGVDAAKKYPLLALIHGGG